MSEDKSLKGEYTEKIMGALKYRFDLKPLDGSKNYNPVYSFINKTLKEFETEILTKVLEKN